MKSGVAVLVCGDDEALVTETARALERVGDGFETRTAASDASASSVGAVDCVVSVQSETPALVETLRRDAPSLPVVAFGDWDADVVSALLEDGATEYVQRGSDEQYVVLAHRIERAVTVDGDAPSVAHEGFERYAEVIEALDDGVYALDDTGAFVFVNEAMAELTGYAVEDLLGEHTSVIKDHEAVTVAESKLRDLLSSDAPDDIGTTFELQLRRADGETVPCEDHMTVLYGPDGEFRGTAGVIRDITERKRREEMLSTLQETSRSLMQAPSREQVAAIVANAAERVLGVNLAVVRLYDADERVLRPAATTEATTDRLGERPVYDLDEGQAGQVFASGEAAMYGESHRLDAETTAQSGIYYPIGVHGTLSVLSEEPDAFDDVDRQVVALLATNAAAACNRAKREQEVRETRERIATILERINGLIENTVEVLVEATTREAVEAGVCAELAATEPYTFAWVGRPAVRGDELVASEWAGDAPIAMEGLSVSTSGDAPGARALAEHTTEVVDDFSGDDEWSERAREAGIESMMAIPLSYTDSTYGVLYVCSDQPDAFDDRERVVLEALGRAVANAINAIESGKILSADKVVELEFTVDDRDLLLSRVSAATGAALSSVDAVTQDDGSLRLYLTTEGGDSDEILAELADDDAVVEATRVAEHEGSALFDVVVETSLLATLVDHGAVPKAVGGENGVARYTIELPYEADAREVFSLVEDNYDGTDLAGYHEHERPVQTRQEFRASLADRFTDRQETALRTAFFGGFFEWPREVDGDELAGAMDISRPTYHQHLRAAQQKVFEELFE
ncbi:GAF domain-containing protein [Halomicroarcula limicola]|uniref:GAF domain-containing protein n=1 Tax=Haloarcula limicola TaxID=1429915 RepID=A0A8J8C610_9EURY|nr:bacterio-opsin activator domain-containing protein [Halomicroarcula limicola]MBV0925784.1 GAF domain-containing protein [Halomicroarcula limicola]